MLRSRSLSMLAASAAVAAGLTLGAASAWATDEGTAVVNGDSLDFQAAAGDVANDVTLSEPNPGRFVLRDSGAPIVAGRGCVQVSADRVRCAVAGIKQSRLDLGLGDDVARVLAALPTREDGGLGDDRLVGGSGDDTLRGREGADRLIGGDGADALDGGDDNDVMDGGAGPDALHGEDGVDSATYAGRSEPVTVTIDDVADDGGSSDGFAGARDNVATDVENLVGGSGDDALTGSEARNSFNGGAGADRFSGAGGVDRVTYASRSESQTVSIDGLADDGDSSDGPPGARDNVATDVENLIGGSGDDSLTGSGEGNRLTGALGADILRGLEGDDVLVANDGIADAELDCDGGAADVVTVDPLDPPSIGCERTRP